jgi:hypothetical protein
LDPITKVKDLESKKVTKLLKSRAGGCLYIVLDGTKIDSSKIALMREILKDAADKPVMVVLSGTKKDTRQVMIGSDSKSGGGLALRTHVKWHIDLADFDQQKLVAIAEEYAREKKECTFEAGLQDQLAKYISEWYEDELHNAGNAHLAHTLVEDAHRLLEEAVFRDKGRKPGVLFAADFRMDVKLGNLQRMSEIDQEIDQLVGMEKAKLWFKNLKPKVKYVEKTGDRSALKTCLNLVLTGNPGTGKTTFARLLYRFMRAYGVLKSEHEIFIERNGKLKKNYCSRRQSTN